MTIFTLGQRLLRTLLWPVRQWLAHLKVHDRQLAHRLCRLIPAQCPFERDIVVAKWHIHIPPLCHLNPLYEELMLLRYRALCYLAEECHEDISAYC